jgi:hypothetical protein
MATDTISETTKSKTPVILNVGERRQNQSQSTHNRTVQATAATAGQQL